jgi:hypothetical protein
MNGFSHIDVDYRKTDYKWKEYLDIAIKEMNKLNYEQYFFNQEKAIDICNNALKISPLCSEAYSTLAEYGDDLSVKIMLFEKAVLTASYDSDEHAYFRAMYGLSIALWQTRTHENRKSAVKYAEHLLKICERDGFGIRYFLLNWYIELGEIKKANRFVNRELNDDASVFGRYAKVLIAFALDHIEQAKQLFEEAFGHNRYVPDYIFGKKLTPHKHNGRYTFGFEDEASFYSYVAKDAWRSVSGAIEWLITTYFNPTHTIINSPVMNNDIPKFKGLAFWNNNSAPTLYLRLNRAVFDTVKCDLRKLRLFSYIEDDNLMFALEYDNSDRWETNVVRNATNSENITNVKLILEEIVANKEMPVVIYYNRSETALKIPLRLIGRQEYFLHSIMYGTPLYYVKDGIEYITDLYDKYGMEYPYRTEIEAKINTIRSLVKNKEINNDSIWSDIRRFVLQKFTLSEIERYYSCKDAVSYIEKKYKINVSFNGISATQSF